MNNELLYFFIALIGLPSMLVLGIILGHKEKEDMKKDIEDFKTLLRKWSKK